MHLSGCIFTVGLTILGTVCFTIKEKDQDRCLEWIGERRVKIMKCIPNSPSQNWTVDGDFIQNPKSELCLEDGLIGRGKLQTCAIGIPTLDRGNDRKVRIEGNHLKNYDNQRLCFGSTQATFTNCDNAKMKEAVVV
jgi:hypothetical protein